MSSRDREPDLFYRFCRAIVRGVIWFFCRPRICGVENVPLEGGVVLAANHASFLDPPAVGIAVPRVLHYMARGTLMTNGLVRRIFDALQVIPLARGEPDIRALRRALKTISSGGAVVVFPEGTRQPEGRLGKPLGGVGFLVARCGAPVVPVRLRGTGNALPKGSKMIRPTRIEVAYGPPMRFDPPPPGGSGAEYYEKVAREVMTAIRRIGPCTEANHSA